MDTQKILLGASAVAVGVGVLLCMRTQGEEATETLLAPKVDDDDEDIPRPKADVDDDDVPPAPAASVPEPEAPPAPVAPAPVAVAAEPAAFLPGQPVVGTNEARAEVRGMVGKFVEMKRSRASIKFQDGKVRSLNPEMLRTIDESEYQAAILKQEEEEKADEEREKQEALKRAEEAAAGL
eukprot:TRINITY_DN19585_c0_g1_i1.p3 TRINITY_DN19585_c0_g1~~TRINITY_DN19585_c0_g1_i1.p3  ORF type:complete len:193 (+),score=63.33 TRINITY_DN19585_c0_g1_i1:41-580(+)